MLTNVSMCNRRSVLYRIYAAANSVTVFADFDARLMHLRGRARSGIGNSNKSPLNVIGDRCRVGPSVVGLVPFSSHQRIRGSICPAFGPQAPVRAARYLCRMRPRSGNRFLPPPVASHSQTRRTNKALRRASTQPASFRPPTALCPPGSDTHTSCQAL